MVEVGGDNGIKTVYTKSVFQEFKLWPHVIPDSPPSAPLKACRLNEEPHSKRGSNPVPFEMDGQLFIDPVVFFNSLHWL